MIDDFIIQAELMETDPRIPYRLNKTQVLVGWLWYIERVL